MPRDGSGIYHRPAGTDGVPNFPIESAKYNTYIADIEQDLNTPRPIVAGGTGASTAAGAITNLGGEQSHQLVTNYDSMAWVSGSFYSAAGATSAPTANAFSGIVYVTDASNIVVEARDAASKGLYVRVMTAGTWSAWKLDNGLYFLDTAPPGAPDGSMWWETDSGILFVRYNDGSSTQWVPATPQQDLTTRVAKAGDTMTGFLTLVGDPIAALNSATKQYVDSSIATGVAAGVAASIKTVKLQKFTTNGTYTPSAGMVYCIIECVGGGGGGGGAPNVASNCMSGSGGAGGNYSRLVASAATIGASKAVTVGGAGNGGVQGITNGTAGTATSVGSLCVANGGNGALNSINSSPFINPPGSPGSPGTGDLQVNGEAGAYGNITPLSAVVGSGKGGNSGLHFGSGANQIFTLTTAPGNAGQVYGGGGSGGMAVTGNANGGAGAAGVVLITEYCTA